jgi:hypothetical protein
LESYPTRGNTPFVPSKIYDSSVSVFNFKWLYKYFLKILHFF